MKAIRQQGKGKADAIKTALNHVDQEYMLFMDGDYTYPPIHIKDLYLKAFQENATHVIGARTLDRKNIPLINRIGNYVLTKTFNILFNTNKRSMLGNILNKDKRSKPNTVQKKIIKKIMYIAYLAQKKLKTKTEIQKHIQILALKGLTRREAEPAA